MPNKPSPEAMAWLERNVDATHSITGDGTVTYHDAKYSAELLAALREQEKEVARLARGHEEFAKAYGLCAEENEVLHTDAELGRAVRWSVDLEHDDVGGTSLSWIEGLLLAYRAAQGAPPEGV